VDGARHGTSRCKLLFGEWVEAAGLGVYRGLNRYYVFFRYNTSRSVGSARKGSLGLGARRRRPERAGDLLLFASSLCKCMRRA
jgi:hypothetical protein